MRIERDRALTDDPWLPWGERLVRQCVGWHVTPEECWCDRFSAPQEARAQGLDKRKDNKQANQWVGQASHSAVIQSLWKKKLRESL